MLPYTIASTVARRQENDESNKIEIDESKKIEKTLLETVQYTLENIFLFPLLLYFLWIWIGIIWYHYYNKWTLATSFYYATEAGLSIGFCNPSERDDGSRGFTVVYVILGSTIIAGSIAAFVSQLIQSKVKLIPNKYKSGLVSMYDSEVNKITFLSFFNYIWYEIKFRIGWYTVRRRVIVTILFIIWMGVGTCYGMLVEDWSFITSLYWAVTSCSTGGLQSAPCRHDPTAVYNSGFFLCDMGVFRGSFMGTYFVIGVPIYAVFVGEYASIIIRKAIERRNFELLSRPLETDEFMFAANILSPEGSDTLVCGEYILLELMRLGKTNANQIVRLKEKFHKLDTNRSDTLDIEDLQAQGMIIQSKHPVYKLPIKNQAINLISRVIDTVTQFRSPDHRRSSTNRRSQSEDIGRNGISVDRADTESAIELPNRGSDNVITTKRFYSNARF